MKQATIDSLRALAERLGAFASLAGDAVPELASEAVNIVQLADDVTDALAAETPTP